MEASLLYLIIVEVFYFSIYSFLLYGPVYYKYNKLYLFFFLFIVYYLLNVFSRIYRVLLELVRIDPD